MLYISHGAKLTGGTAAILVLAAVAQAHAAHSHRAGLRQHKHHDTLALSRRPALATSQAGTLVPSGYGGGDTDGAAFNQYAASAVMRPTSRYVDQYAAPQSTSPARADAHAQFADLVERHASANGVPTSLVHRVIMRESGYNPRAVSAGNYGIMQIRLGTARAMGYAGSAAGLLDAETNMTYAVRNLAGAYRAAGGNEARAVALYARGYQ